MGCAFGDILQRILLCKSGKTEKRASQGTRRMSGNSPWEPQAQSCASQPFRHPQTTWGPGENAASRSVGLGGARVCISSCQGMLRPQPAWRGEGLERGAGRLCPLLPPQTRLIPAHHPQENTPYTHFQGLRPPLTSPSLELVHTVQVSSQTLGGSRRF